ncbi:MAG: RNA 3'-terminal phosphate cyclase [Candidatus Aenigmarchaeota archaeon]|nr:RNA 3'-terminal phosphate cyclase [Candidatus Aenigmarchaeota archaeon]NIP40819.1 RNA 3'-terminal phosphate cyclase [Candidatus Aenigmarchaeota archaeon]NIQ17933.1 RNA 3'-terminal phosphate cyclase [Candidatus Aenigmarchaeota archaeon]NIS73522.1 RNA 3'-terminal phosphate cyclase [Candidatus Aenigmarchaeota archaeon]
MMEIPGEYGSGSGTIVRLSTAFSALTGKPIRITDIRAKRPSPGLRHQHLEAVRTLGKICSAKIKGDQVGSREIEFHPGKIKGGTFDVNIETAGSIGLLSYAVLLPAVFGKDDTVLKIRGGSIASLWSPPVPYLENVLLPILSRMGVLSRFTVKKHGFYPVGGSDVEFEINPVKRMNPIVMKDPGKVESINGLSLSSALLKERKVAERQIVGFHRVIRKEKGVDVKPVYVESECPGSVIVLWAETSTWCILAGDHVGERRKPAEVVGREAAFRLQEEIKYGSTVGGHLADQLIPFMALAKGRSEIIAPDLTEHVKTNIWLCEKFLGSKFKTQEEGENFRIVCSGK